MVYLALTNRCEGEERAGKKRRDERRADEEERSEHRKEREKDESEEIESEEMETEEDHQEKENDEERYNDNEKDNPDQFRSYLSTLEICEWLVNTRPDILNLAYQMLEAKKPASFQKSVSLSDTKITSSAPIFQVKS